MAMHMARPSRVAGSERDAEWAEVPRQPDGFAWEEVWLEQGARAWDLYFFKPRTCPTRSWNGRHIEPKLVDLIELQKGKLDYIYTLVIANKLRLRFALYIHSFTLTP